MKTAMLLSGGVDSSVALRLLLDAGETDVTAFYLRIWLDEDLAFLGECPFEEDLLYARAVCEQAQVPLEVVPLQAEYRRAVVDETLSELRAGNTPSPDILCNSRIKFGCFLEKIDGSFARVASGHYARSERRGGLLRLLRAPDPVKDQTYFLSQLNQEQLARARFPVGDRTKAEVRALAARYGLPNRDRPDSQGICFLGKISYPDFVLAQLGRKTGDIVEQESGRKLGEHRGYWFHTIGQRKGLGLSGGPWFVVGKDVEKNEVLVSHAAHLARCSRDRFTVRDVHWIAGPPDTTSLLTRLRHTPHLEPCEIEFREGDRLEITLQHKDPGVAPGQSAVLYDGEICLGRGVIE
ncbi:MAG: tRNA 2-thiouridine(34) synthase MnmA [Planctomycetota bacterium]